MSDDLVKRLRDPAFGTETTERNLMNSAADRIEEPEAEAHTLMMDDYDGEAFITLDIALKELKAETDE